MWITAVSVDVYAQHRKKDKQNKPCLIRAPHLYLTTVGDKNMSWQEYVDSSLKGSGVVAHAAILGSSDGSIWAKDENFNVRPLANPRRVLVLVEDAPRCVAECSDFG